MATKWLGRKNDMHLRPDGNDIDVLKVCLCGMRHVRRREDERNSLSCLAEVGPVEPHCMTSSFVNFLKAVLSDNLSMKNSG